MPPLSWPRCWSAYRPRYVMLAASGWPKMPKTPHSSLNLSGRSPIFTALSSECKPFLSRHALHEIPADRRGPDPFGLIDRLVNDDSTSNRDPQPVAAGLPDHPGGYLSG